MVIRLSNVTNKYIPTCCNYVRRQAISAKQEIVSGKNYYHYNLKNGWHTGKRLAKLKNQNPLRALCTKIYASVTKAKIRQKDIPAILGTVGLFSPVPAASVVGFGLGKLINKCLKIFNLKNRVF